MDDLPEGYGKTPTYWVVKETATQALWDWFFERDDALEALSGLDPLKYYAEEIGGIIFWTG